MADINYRNFTLGIEEEYMVLDPKTKELKSHEQKIVTEGQKVIRDKVKAEMHQAVVEVGTDICQDIHEARKDVTTLRKTIAQIAGDLDLHIGAAGTHPFSHWESQLITDHIRYSEIVNELQEAARSNLIFGLHVHVGMESREMANHIANSTRYFLPHVYALSTNSPFWEGRQTGYKSYRTKVFDKFPRTGIPEYFESIEAYDNFVKLLVKTNCIDNAKKIWWDVRPHPTFGTLEFRVFDVATRLDEAIAIAALTQALVVKLHRLYTRNMSYRMYPRALIEENKWRAARWGVEGKLIDFGKQAEVPMRELGEELLEFTYDVAGELGSRAALEPIHRILREGTSAERQLRVFKETGDLKAVVKHIVAETSAGVTQQASSA